MIESLPTFHPMDGCPKSNMAWKPPAKDPPWSSYRRRRGLEWRFIIPPLASFGNLSGDARFLASHLWNTWRVNFNVT